MKLRWPRIDPNERYATPVLLRELGIWRTLQVGPAVRAAVARGEPFGELPAPVDERERLSREQIAGAIVLYRLLLPLVPQTQALTITEHVVVAAGAHFLRETLGTISQSEIAKMNEDERTEFARSRGARFFNATMQWDEISEDRVRFTITHCHFPILCAQAGVPELSPVFCAVDAHFFGTVEPGVMLERPDTIARGAPSCGFSLAFAKR
jgi:hypothetical protein